MLQELLFIVFIFISLGAGMWAVLLTNRLYKTHRINYLLTYLYNQILRFIFGLYGLIGLAIVTWMLQEMETPTMTVKAITSFIPYLGIPFVIAAWYMFIKMSMEMAGRSVSSKLTFAYFAFMLVIILGYGYLIVHLFREQSENAQRISDYARYIYIGTELVTLSIAFYVLYVLGSRIRHRRNRQAVRNFAHINLLVSSAGVVLFFLVDRSPIIAGAYIFIFFSGSLPAIVYLGKYLDRNFLSTADKTENLTPYADFIDNYKISKREWEIIEKVGEGMTNRQISDTLFISLQTVKDHTHRIYRKTGARNRVQLVNMLNELRIPGSVEEKQDD